MWRIRVSGVARLKVTSLNCSVDRGTLKSVLVPQLCDCGEGMNRAAEDSIETASAASVDFMDLHFKYFSEIIWCLFLLSCAHAGD